MAKAVQSHVRHVSQSGPRAAAEAAAALRQPVAAIHNSDGNQEALEAATQRLSVSAAPISAPAAPSSLHNSSSSSAAAQGSDSDDDDVPPPVPPGLESDEDGDC